MKNMLQLEVEIRKEFEEKEKRLEQLERENLCFKKKILENVISENTEITSLKFKIEELENENRELRKRITLIRLQNR